MHTAALCTANRRTGDKQGEMRVSGRGTERRRGGSGGERMSTFPVFSQWLNAVKVAQLVWKVSCSVRRVGVSLRSGGVSEQKKGRKSQEDEEWVISALPLRCIQYSQVASSVEIYKSPHPAELAWSLSLPIIKRCKDTDDLWDVFTVTSRAPKTVTYWATQRALNPDPRQQGQVIIGYMTNSIAKNLLLHSSVSDAVCIMMFFYFDS